MAMKRKRMSLAMLAKVAKRADETARQKQRMADHYQAQLMIARELEESGEYSDIILTRDHGLVGIGRFIYTCGVCLNLDETGYVGRFCFDTLQNARLFLQDWDCITPPTVGLDGCTAIKGVNYGQK